MLDWINKERVVFILALLLFLWGLYGFLSPEDPAGRIPRGKALDRVATVFLPPDLRIASSDEIYRKGRKDLFAEPVALKPLKPLELAPPPLANAPLTAPPPVPGPPPRYWQGLRHRTVPAAQGGPAAAAGTGAGASGETAGGPGTAAGATEEKPAVEPGKTYDSIVKKGSEVRIYGRIRNENPLSLVEMEKDDAENQFVLKDGVRLQFDYYDPITGLRRGVETLSASQIDVFSLAATDQNLYAVKRRRLPVGNVAARLTLARWLVSIGRVEWASREYQAALELDPHRDEVYLELGKTLEREFLWEEALACFRLARKNGVDSAALLYGEGKLLMRFGMPGQAIGLLRRALELDRGDTRVRLALGECLLETGQALAAIDELKQAYGASAPTGTPVLNQLWVDAAVALGRSLLHVGDFREAMRYYRSVVEEDRDRTCTVARKGLGASLYAMGTPEGLNEALDVWSSVNESGLSREMLINRGYGLARLGRYAEARTAFESARRDDPLHAGLATMGLAFVAECEGKYDSALELYGESLVSNPGALYVYLAMGRIQRKQGDFEAARASLQKVLDEAPDSVDALVEMATAALAVNQYADALRYLERVREIDPATLHWQSMLGAALLRAQREQQAVDTFEKVLARRDDDPVSLVNQAVVYYRRGEVAKAIGNLQSAVESGRTDPTVQPLVDYARRTAAAIEDNTRKRLWEDDFNRTEIRNDWTTEHSHGVIIREHNGQVHFAGMQKDGNDTETALLRTVSLGELVTFDAALTVSPGVKARTGVEMMVRRGGRGTTTLMGAIQFGRDSRGQMAYRVFDDGAFQDWQLLGGTWPGPGAVRLGFERADPTGYKWNLTVNGRVIKRGVEVKKFRNWNRDGLIGVFGSAKLGTEWSFDMDDVRMILRLPK